MLKQLLSGLVISALCSAPVLADHDSRRPERANPFPGQGRTDTAKVINVTPVTRDITQRVPVENCWQERVRYEAPTHQPYQSATPVLLGGLIGAAIGNSLGHSHHKTNRDIKTVAGGLLGASIGSDIARRQNSAPGRVEYRNEERCEVSYDTRHEQQIIGYDVTYRYHGETYQTRMDYDPGKQIKVKVNVRPVM